MYSSIDPDAMFSRKLEPEILRPNVIDESVRKIDMHLGHLNPATIRARTSKEIIVQTVSSNDDCYQQVRKIDMHLRHLNPATIRARTSKGIIVQTVSSNDDCYQQVRKIVMHLGHLNPATIRALTSMIVSSNDDCYRNDDCYQQGLHLSVDQFQPTAASRMISSEEFNTYFEKFWEQVRRDQVEGVAKAHHLRKGESINFLYKVKKNLRNGLYFANPAQAAALTLLGGDIEAQFSEPSVDPYSIPDPVGLSDRTTAEHNTGRLEENIAENTEALMSGGQQNIDPLSFEMSPPDGPEQNTGILRARGDLILSLIQSNRIRQLAFVSVCNLVSNAMVGANYLQNDLQGVHDTFWKAQRIASFGVPIAVSVSTLLSSFRFASDPERWSNWITGLSSVNAGMIAGGPLAFYFMRNQGTKN